MSSAADRIKDFTTLAVEPIAPPSRLNQTLLGIVIVLFAILIIGMAGGFGIPKDMAELQQALQDTIAERGILAEQVAKERSDKSRLERKVQDLTAQLEASAKK